MHQVGILDYVGSIPAISSEWGVSVMGHKTPAKSRCFRGSTPLGATLCRYNIVEMYYFGKVETWIRFPVALK